MKWLKRVLQRWLDIAPSVQTYVEYTFVEADGRRTVPVHLRKGSP